MRAACLLDFCTKCLLKHRQESAGSQAAQSCSSWDWAAMQHSLWCLSGPQACTTSMWTQLEPQRPGPYCSQRMQGICSPWTPGQRSIWSPAGCLSRGAQTPCAWLPPGLKGRGWSDALLGHTECHAEEGLPVGGLCICGWNQTSQARAMSEPIPEAFAGQRLSLCAWGPLFCSMGELRVDPGVRRCSLGPPQRRQWWGLHLCPRAAHART